MQNKPETCRTSHNHAKQTRNMHNKLQPCKTSHTQRRQATNMQNKPQTYKQANTCMNSYTHGQQARNMPTSTLRALEVRDRFDRAELEEFEEDMLLACWSSWLRDSSVLTPSGEQ